MSKFVFLAEADILNTIAQAGTMSAGELAARFGVSPDAMRHHTRKLRDAGTITAVEKSLGNRGAQFAVADQSDREPPKPKYVGEIVPPFRAEVWTPPLKNYAAKLYAAADLALAGRA